MSMGNEFWQLGQVTDERLLEAVRGLVHEDRRLSARLLAHLAEVDERRLHLRQAKSSMFEYCLELGMSEDEAGRRLSAASVAKRFPSAYGMLDEGKLCLSVLCKLKHYLTEENHAELLEGVSGMSYRKAELWLAGRFPRPDAPSMVRKLPSRSSLAAAMPTGTTSATVAEPEAATSRSDSTRAEPGTSAAAAGAGPTRSSTNRSDRSRVEPLATDRFRVQFTGSAELIEKLELVADLMAHRNPRRDIALIVEQGVDLLLAKLRKERFAETDRPRGSRPAKSRTVTSETQRAVLERDGLQCSFVDEHGRRCASRAFLERDHIRPRGKRGGSGADNVRHLCRAHNQWLAEVEYGRDHIERAKKAARTRRFAHVSATSRNAGSESDCRMPGETPDSS